MDADLCQQGLVSILPYSHNLPMIAQHPSKRKFHHGNNTFLTKRRCTIAALFESFPALISQISVIY
jgi:hypothetical protein